MENFFEKVFAIDEMQDILQLATAELKTSDGCLFPVHKAILARANIYFRKVFCHPDSKDKRQFMIPGVSGEILSEILIYLYTGKCFYTENTIAELIKGADYLCVKDLVTELHENYKDKINVSNCLLLLFHAHHINSDGMFKDVMRFTQLNFETVVNHHKTMFAELPLDLLSLILRCKNLRVSDERPIWLVIVEWVLKDLQCRLPFVPFLLKHLAKKEVNESLAKEIASHSIVNNNSYCKISSDFEFGKSLQTFLTMIPDSNFDYRIPPKLYIIAKRVENSEFDSCNIYATYEENLDLWRRIATVCFHSDHLILIHNNLHMFSFKGYCSKLDLKENNLMYTNHFFHHEVTSLQTVSKHEQLIYVFGRQDNKPNLQVLDPETNLWKNATPYLNLDFFEAASISGKLYVVGNCLQTCEATAGVYDKESDTWSSLPSSTLPFPNIDIVVHREKFFVIGGRGSDFSKTVAIFDPKTENWRHVVDLPVRKCLKEVYVMDDRLFVFWKNSSNVKPSPPGYTNAKLVWNDELECWDENNEKLPLLNIGRHAVCEVRDAETIQIISKGDQFKNIELQSCDFS